VADPIRPATTSNTSSTKDVSEDIAVKTGLEVGLKGKIVAELDAGYEIYRVIRLSF
jgi:hypothetical protein